jgi:hypothetical protein
MKAADSTKTNNGPPSDQDPVRWLWPGYLPRGAVVVLDGDPGSGKSVMVADLAARLSRGGTWPDGTPVGRPGNAILFAAEDLRDQVVWPRLKAAGADAGRIGVYGTPDSGEELPCLPENLSQLEELFGADWPDLLVFDPLAYFIHGPASALAVRYVLGRLSSLAARHAVTIMVIRHLIKYLRARAMYRGLGSISIIGAARTAMLAAADPGDPTRFVLSPTKSNYAAMPTSLAYRIVNVNGTAGVEWLGPTSITAEEASRGPRPETAEKPGAVMAADWLVKTLEKGELPAAALVEKAKAAGISERSLERAKKILYVQSRLLCSNGKREWIWKLPDPPPVYDDLPTFEPIRLGK